jgi:hypothetical protein
VITAVDTSVLLDVFTADPKFGPRSRDALRRCRAEGSLIACDIVWAELGGAFADESAAAAALAALEVAFDPLDARVALTAGRSWRTARAERAASGTRRRILPDFLIGAHARGRAERLLTRDRGFYRSAFADLVILEP